MATAKFVKEKSYATPASCELFTSKEGKYILQRRKQKSVNSLFAEIYQLFY